MKGALQSVPLMIAFAPNNKYIHFYASGVIDARDCYTGDDDINPINQAALLVGYGTDEDTGLKYWLIKNDWGTTWGDEGYVKIAMDSSNSICGVQTYVMLYTTN